MTTSRRKVEPKTAGRRKIEFNRVDTHVGSRVRLRRALLGMSQEKLGEAIGLTFQQVQKYERGANRIAASRLFDLSRVLDVPVSFFFDDMPGAGDTTRANGGGSTHAIMEIGRHLNLLSPKQMDVMLSLAKSMADVTGDGARSRSDT